MATLMNGDPTREPEKKRGRPLGSKDSKPRQPRSDSAKRRAEAAADAAAKRKRENDGMM